MSYRKLNGTASLLRIYLSDFDRHQHHALHEYIVEQARESGLAGCTVYAGFWGYGDRGFIHTDIAVEGAGERPVIVEITDTRERVREFAGKVVPWLKRTGGLITEESVQVHHHQSSQDGSGQTAQEGSMAEAGIGGEDTLLRVFIGESDRYGNKPLFEAILECCKELGIAGCTAIKGLMGYGASSVVHKGHIFRISQDLPMVIEVVDSRERIQKLLVQLGPMLQGALVIEEEVHVHHRAARGAA